MPPIRILIVDDSVVIRKVLTDVLSSDAAFEVVGTASDGRIALTRIAQLRPDLVTLDVEMPNLSGLDTIPEIRKLSPKLPIIMFSNLTARGAATTLDALALGASDYSTKPASSLNLEATVQHIRQDLLPKIKSLCGWRSTAEKSPPTQLASRELASRDDVAKRAPAIVNAPPRTSSPIEILAIGASTGGPNALAELIPAIPEDFPIPIVIVQHMPPLFTRALAERLDSKSLIPVREGASGKKLEPGQAWIAPGDFHMTVERRGSDAYLALNQDRPENSCRPAVDVLFRSVVSTFGPKTLAVVLTGMGSDGVLGARIVRERGGRVIVQDENTSIVWGMPGQVASAGFADHIYPLGSIATEVNRQVRASRLSLRAAPGLAFRVG
jgi:two-component system, chemotaxis family, protein-glutamate methylesterase/glutaminase